MTTHDQDLALLVQTPDFVAALEKQIGQLPSRSNVLVFFGLMAAYEGHKNPGRHEVAQAAAGFYKTLLEHFPLPGTVESSIKTLPLNDDTAYRALLGALTPAQSQALNDFVTRKDELRSYPEQDIARSRIKRRMSKGFAAAAVASAALTGGVYYYLRQPENNIPPPAPHSYVNNLRGDAVPQLAEQPTDGKLHLNPNGIFILGGLVTSLLALFAYAQKKEEAFNLESADLGSKLNDAWDARVAAQLLGGTNELLQNLCKAHAKEPRGAGSRI